VGDNQQKKRKFIYIIKELTTFDISMNTLKKDSLPSSQSGFTLIEILLVIAMLAILAAVVIIAINPAKQFGEAQNAQRRSDVSSILDAIHQYKLDNAGALPADGIQTASSCDTALDDICKSGASCTGVNIEALIEDEIYLRDIPNDPTTSNDEITGYKIFLTDYGRVGICAPGAYNGEAIGVVR
jgi:type IV pilus assembly protein PilA